MDFYYNIESIDITQTVEQFKGKKIEDLFPDHEIIKNSMGKFINIKWKESDFLCNLNLLSTKKNITTNLKTVYYIGDYTERKLFRRGTKNLKDLLSYPRFRNSAQEILELIDNHDYKQLCSNNNIYDIDVLFCFDIEELLFLDIETLGIYDSPIIIVGLGFYRKNSFEIHQYFAQELEDEIAICEHLRNEILPCFKTFITYNGKSFDIPYMANRFLYFFDENPMISENDIPYENSNTRYHHVDLYWNCRRQFKNKFHSYTLTSMERKLLDWKRGNDLPSNLVGLCYKKYKKDPEQYVGLIKEIIDHNYYDLYSMPLILEKILESK